MRSQSVSRPVTILLLSLMATLVPMTGNTKTPTSAKKKPAGANNEQPAAPMYRYTNDSGVLVTASTITPEYARKGYQIVTITGIVMETVPPEPTAEERAKIEQDNQDKVSAAQQLEKDKQLLLRYSTLEEIQFAKTRKLTEIDNNIVLLNSNVATLKSQLDVEQQRAAVHERNGQAVPPALLKKIDDLQQELKITEGQVASRKQELAEETTRFDKDIERLTILEKTRPKR